MSLRRRLTSHAALLIAISVVAVLAAAVIAYGYYTANGKGTASAHVGTIAAPSITSATAGAGSVALSWSAVTPPGSGAVTYYVKRDGGAASAACPSSAAPASVTSCTDTGVSTATHSYTVTAAWRSWTGTSTSTNVSVTYGPVTQLVYATQPSGASGGTALTTQPVVTAKDAAGNVVANYSGTVALSIKGGTGTAGATLSGCGGSLANGVTTFSGCKIDKSGANYKLTASDGTRTVDSNNLTITVGSVAQLAFTQQPAGAVAGSAFTTQPKVTAQDAGGNTVTTYSGTVTLSITSGTGTVGATLDNCNRTTTNGVASFTNCEIKKSGGGYQLHASDSTRVADSSAFAVTPGAMADLAFTTQPAGATGGTAFTTQPVVTALDSEGNVATSYAGTVTLSIRQPGTDGTLHGCTQSRSNGVVTFSGCIIDEADTGFRLRAKDGSPQDDSSSFNVTVGALAQLAFTQQPSGATAGSAFTTQPKVTAQDAGGNTITTYAGTVTLSIKTNPGGATLTACTSSRSNGVTTFSACKLDKSGSGYVLTASDGTRTADSSSFNVVAGAATQLLFTTQPSGATGGTAFAAQPVVTAYDANGNVATSYSSTVSLTLTNASGATLSSCNGNRSNGVVTFSGCKVNKAGSGYGLHASDGTRTADSATFAVTAGSAAQFVLTATDTTPTVGVSTALTITAQDAGGNLATSYTGTHSLTFGGASTSAAGNMPTVTNSGGSAVAFGSATTIAFTNGTATASAANNGAMTLRKAETKTITATDGTVVDDGSLSVVASAASGTKLAWTSVNVSGGTLSSPCLFICTDTGIGNSGTFKANVSVTDADGNVVSVIGGGSHSVTVQSTSGSGVFTPGNTSSTSLSISGSGTATSSAQFTFRAQSGTWTSNAFKASTAGYSDATATVTK